MFFSKEVNLWSVYGFLDSRPSIKFSMSKGIIFLKGSSIDIGMCMLRALVFFLCFIVLIIWFMLSVSFPDTSIMWFQLLSLISFRTICARSSFRTGCSVYLPSPSIGASLVFDMMVPSL